MVVQLGVSSNLLKRGLIPHNFQMAQKSPSKTPEAFCSSTVQYPSYLEGDTANRKVLSVLEHAEVFGNQGGTVDQALGSLCVVVPLRVLPCHVL